MIIPSQPNFTVVNTADYRETYANSVQVRVNVWDFFLVFGTMQQQSENQVEVRNFQGIYLSPQQAKALAAILHQNVSNYESTFGEIKLDPRPLPLRAPYIDEGQNSALREEPGGGRESRVPKRRSDSLDSVDWTVPDFLSAPDLRPLFPAFPSLLLG